MDIELKLGSEFIVDELKLIVVKGHGCNDCIFGRGNGCTNEYGLICAGCSRQDKTDVMFVESNLSENPQDSTEGETHAESKKNDIIDNKVRMDLLPWPELEEIGKVYTAGAKKYGPNQWQNLTDGYQRYKGAMLRHLTELEKGNDIDEETGCMHAAQIAWNAIAMLHFKLKEKEDKE